MVTYTFLVIFLVLRNILEVMLVTNWKGGIVAVVVVVVVDNVVGAAVCSQKYESKKALRLSHSTG